jgi:hypothetical protein
VSELETDMAEIERLFSDKDDYSARELFPKVFVLRDYKEKGNRPVGTFDCGSVKCEGPCSLYIAMFLSRPKSVDFSDMYKASLLCWCSPDYRFVASFELFKYEPALYFSASKELVCGQASSIQAGAPGADNGISSNDPLFLRWCKLLETCLDREWMVYGGNDFKV